MSDIVAFSPVRALDRDGIPAPGALASFTLSGTTTPQPVYTDGTLTVAHPDPLEADANGVFPPVFSAVALRCTVTDADGVTLPGFPVDPVTIIPTGSGADQITFTPTGSIPETDVQAAIERVQANLVAPLLAGGIGVTGNTDILASLNATNIPSGAYRFDGTTAGTFPAGVVASGGGTVTLWRETATEASMELTARGQNFTWQRTLTGGVYGAWRTLNPSAQGKSLVEVSTPLAARDVILAPAKPTSVVGEGEFRSVNAAAGVSLALPAGGRWAYFVLTTNGSGAIAAFNVGTANGGTTIVGASGGANNGFAWRIE